MAVVTRDPFKTLRFFSIAAVLALAGCAGGGNLSDVSAESGDEGGFNLFGALFDGKKKPRPAPVEGGRESPGQPIPRKVLIGNVHLVHESGGFVLIRAIRMPPFPADAELMTFTEQGKPTGTLRISPERKDNFRVADIVAGLPRVGDEVILFGMENADGEMTFGSGPDDPGASEVLE